MVRGLGPVLVACVALAGCKKAPPEAAAPREGWQTEEGWRGSCYFSPNFDEMGLGDRRMARNDALQAMMDQWRGDKSDGMAVDPVVVENIETVLLGAPEKIEAVTADNAAQCVAYMKGKASSADWGTWLTGLPGRLLEGECLRPLDVTIFDYLELGIGWQFTQDICEDNVVRITATSADEYRIVDDGPWINAAGDPNMPATSEYPCSTEDCLAGQIILRFVGESGTEIIRPVGLELVFDPPEHGTISVRVNDMDYYDNQFRVERGVQHRTGITYKPVE